MVSRAVRRQRFQTRYRSWEEIKSERAMPRIELLETACPRSLVLLDQMTKEIATASAVTAATLGTGLPDGRGLYLPLAKATLST